MAEEFVARNEGAPRHATPATSAADDLLADALDTPNVRPPARGRSDRGRPAGPPAARQPAAPAFRPPPAGGLAPLPGESLSGALVAKLPGESLSGDRVKDLVAPIAPPPVAYEAPSSYEPEPEDGDDAPGAPGEGPMRKRRRRRRRGRGGNAAGETAAPVNGEAAEPVIAAAPQAPVNPETVTEVEGRKRRRRRRRRRGGSGIANGANGVLGASTLPDRHIISVDGDGGASPTGQTAPPQPNRSLAPWNRPRKGEIAIEPPPPSLSAPVEEVRATAPSRRRAPAPPGRIRPRRADRSGGDQSAARTAQEDGRAQHDRQESRRQENGR